MKKFLAALVVVMLAVIFTVGASAETYLRGDINKDGKLSASDARATLRIGAKLDEATEEQKLIADMNDDGKISATDARTILRISAKLEDPKGEISIGGNSGEETERTELSSGISMSFKDFMKKFGGMRELDTTDGTISYTNDYVTVVSDPKMITSGNINAISITGGDYMICGVYAGMPVDEALAALKSAKWIVDNENASQVTLSKVGMKIRLAKAGDVVSFVEYYLGISIVTPDDTTTSTTETTTQPPETTTQPPETTTKPAETTTNPPETTTKPSATSEDFEKLPEQAKAFLLGNFSLKGYTYNGGNRDYVSMYVTKDNVRCGMMMESEDGKPMDVDVLITDMNSKSATTYLISNDTKKYCKLDTITMGILGLKPEDFKLSFTSIDPATVTVSINTVKEGMTEYTVYKLKAGAEISEVYMIGDNIKRICSYDTKGVLVSRFDVETFSAGVPASAFSLNGYKKVLTLLSIFS
ncbi:MAG: dockerin type I repeat-containing protein [Clostridia bacterium]|nr:dockerin type I repeat-containing protein [Clostridia bacterium]